jgi:hypothetical protein
MKVRANENRRVIVGLEISGGECILYVVDFERIVDGMSARQLDP